MTERRDLYFVCRDRGIDRLIAENVTEDGAFEHIRVFCEERGFRIYYIRSWEAPAGCKHYDVGSHTEFFEWRKA